MSAGVPSNAEGDDVDVVIQVVEVKNVKLATIQLQFRSQPQKSCRAKVLHPTYNPVVGSVCECPLHISSSI